MFTTSDAAPRRRKGWGKAKGHKIVAKVARDGKITITFDKFGGTWKALGEYGPWFDSAIDIYTRDICYPFHNAWKDVDPQHKRDMQDHKLVYEKLHCFFCVINFSLS